MGSIINGLNFYLMIVIFGTLWRLIALHLIASSSASLQKLGKVMAFQY